MKVLICVVFFLSLTQPMNAGAQPAPMDPPVASGGQGPSQNDWIDFLNTPLCSGKNISYIDSNTGVIGHYPSLVMTITADNPNYSAGLNTANGTQVDHWFLMDNYGDDGDVPTVGEGNAYWDSCFSGYFPDVTRADATVTGSFSDCTTHGNCMTYAFNAYIASYSLTAIIFSDTASATSLINCCQQVGSAPPHVSSPPGDRCYDTDGPNGIEHIWTICNRNPPFQGSSPKFCERGLIWKDNTSGIYWWFPRWHDSHTFADDSPTEWNNGFYNTYAVIRYVH
jgi:hypothetical protein